MTMPSPKKMKQTNWFIIGDNRSCLKYNTSEDITSEITRFGEEKKSSRALKAKEHSPNTRHMGDKNKKGKNYEAQNIGLVIKE
jgi:hypothetical protein